MYSTTDSEWYFGEIIIFIATLSLRLQKLIMLGKEQE